MSHPRMCAHNQTFLSMKLTRQKVRVLVLASLAVILPFSAHAENATGLVDCFDFYRFGSVQTRIEPATASTVSGVPMTFSGTVVNENPYPIVDGALYVKVFANRAGVSDANGPDVVDEFLVKGGMAIPAGSSTSVTFQWAVPAYAKSGAYTLATFFSTSRKFNLSGLSFTDDVTGNRVPFTVSAEQKDSVRFEKSGATVAGIPYRFAAFPPVVSATATIPVSVVVRNDSARAERVTVSWSVSQWDAQLRENVVHEEEQAIDVPAHGKGVAKVEVKDTRYPVYLVKGTLKWRDTKSIVGIRFVRQDVERLRINFPGISHYPLRAGEQNTLFSCLHNSGMGSLVSGGKLDLTLTDERGSIVHEYTYEGDVSGSMMGVADSFVPTRDYANFSLDARLYRNGEFVDEAHLVYDCKVLDPGACPPNETSLDSLFEGITKEWQSSYTLLAGIIAVLIIGFLLRKKHS